MPRVAIDTDPIFSYKIANMDIGSSVSYFGFVDTTGRWYIMKVTDTEAKYSKGNTNYSEAWNQRTSLEYKFYDEVF